MALLSTPRNNARRRALRAARVVTLGFALAGGGCYQQHGPEVTDAGTTTAEDARVGADAGAVGLDSGLDSGLADAGPACDASDRLACCDELGWPCDSTDSWGCCAWGPYVPPSDDALLGRSRVQTQAWTLAA